MRKRKLITQDTLEAIIQDLERGVPLARAMRNNSITMSRPAVNKLVESYIAAELNEPAQKLIFSSLFPSWLKEDQQEQPDNAKYKGFFPYGAWL